MPNEFGAAVLARSWWAMALRGVVGIALGVLAFLLPAVTLTTLVLLLAAYLLADGVLSLIASLRAIRHHDRWWALLLEGLVDLVAGGVVMLWPGLSVLALVWVVAVWAIFTGAMALVGATILPLPHGRVPAALSGALSIGLGIVMIALPFLGVLTLVWWLAAYFLVFGVFQLGLSVQLYRAHHGQRRVAV